MGITKTGRELFGAHGFFTLKRKLRTTCFSNSQTSKIGLRKKEPRVHLFNKLFEFHGAINEITENDATLALNTILYAFRCMRITKTGRKLFGAHSHTSKSGLRRKGPQAHVFHKAIELQCVIN